MLLYERIFIRSKYGGYSYEVKTSVAMLLRDRLSGGTMRMKKQGGNEACALEAKFSQAVLSIERCIATFSSLASITFV